MELQHLSGHPQLHHGDQMANYQHQMTPAAPTGDEKAMQNNNNNVTGAGGQDGKFFYFLKKNSKLALLFKFKFSRQNFFFLQISQNSRNNSFFLIVNLNKKKIFSLRHFCF